MRDGAWWTVVDDEGVFGRRLVGRRAGLWALGGWIFGSCGEINCLDKVLCMGWLGSLATIEHCAKFWNIG